MRLKTGSGVAIVTLLLAGCGGGAASPAGPQASLSTAQRLVIARQVIAAALGGVFAGGPVQRDTGPLAGVSCEKTCDASGCVVSCPIDERFSCPSGGSATNRGTVAGTVDAQGSGEAALSATETYAGCRPSAELAIDGAPSTTASGSARLLYGQLADEQTLRVAGSVSYTSAAASGRCDVDLSITFSRALHGSASGEACGQKIDTAF
jgi:hypothetical protein